MTNRNIRQSAAFLPTNIQLIDQIYFKRVGATIKLNACIDRVHSNALRVEIRPRPISGPASRLAPSRDLDQSEFVYYHRRCSQGQRMMSSSRWSSGEMRSSDVRTGDSCRGSWAQTRMGDD